MSKPPDVVISLRSRVRVTLADGSVLEPTHLPDAGIALIGFIGGTIIAVEQFNPYGITITLDVGAITMECTNEQFESFGIVGDGREIYV
ncbi:MAG: hypothetical protein KF745_12710 [Phycisphaeraceae bacterium]|nr:hypothetical protein [Phycisphaeraceae bacterium]